MEKNLIKEKGITLIALVVTIIILLILSLVAMNFTIGDNGIITRAKEAKIESEIQTVRESLLLKTFDGTIDNVGKNKKLIEWLKEKGYINDKNEVNVVNTVGNKLSVGNGTDTNDVFVIEGNILYYYNANGDKRDLGIITEAISQEDLFEITEDGEISLKDYENYYSNGIKLSEILTIPSEINGITVTKISDYFIAYLSGVAEVRLPDTIKEIGVGAFVELNDLKKINIPNGVKKIGGSAFLRCINLESIEIPNGVEEIGGFAFAGCIMLESIEIPNSVTAMHPSTFASCSNLKTVNICNNVIPGNAFENCENLETVQISKNVEKIEWNAFLNCNSIKETIYEGTEEEWNIISISYR